MPTQRVASRARVERLCSAGGDALSLRLSLLGELCAVVPFDAHVWLLTDPSSAVGVAPLATVPSLEGLPRTIRLKYLTATNRWSRLDPARPVGLLRQTLGKDAVGHPLWLHLREAYGVSDVASIVFRDRFGCWSFLDLWRLEPAPPFDDDDADHLATVAQTITAALRRCQAQTFLEPTPRADEEVGPMVLILDEELEVQEQTEATMRWLALLLPAAPGAQPIPAAAYNVAAQLLAVEQGVDEGRPAARVHLDGGLWVTFRAARLGDRSIAVTIERTSPPDRLDVFSRCHGLSRREAELLGHLATGADTRTAAQQLHLSANTVQDHLKSIFDKTGVRNRPTLLSRALGRA